MAAGTAEKPKTGAAEAKVAEKAENGRGAIDEAHKALGTKPGDVPGANIDTGPQDVHDGDELAQSASGAPVQLGFNVGGKKPTSTTLRLTGGRMDTDRVFQKGEKVQATVVLVVGEVAFADQVDSATDQVVGCERRHKARIVDFAFD